MHCSEPTSGVAAPTAGRFSWWRLPVWLIAASLLGAVAAWGAVIVQFYFAPLLLFPLLVGVGLGAMLVGLLRVAQIGNRPTLWTGAVLAVTIAVIGEHYVSYHEARHRQARQDQETLDKARLAFPDLLKERGLDVPESFPEYMQQQAAQGRAVFGWKIVGQAAWASWAIDGILLLIAAVAVMIPAVRQPYCNHCHSWYRTVRSGRIPEALARQVAEAAAVTIGGPFKAARFRLSNCVAGCGSTRLELSWETPDGQTFLSTVWLEPQRRDTIGQVLDAEPPDTPRA